jgi:hypothetical protein
MILEHPPQWHVRQKLDSNLIGRTDFYFEWIAFGLTAVCFWTAPWLWITTLENRLRLRNQGTLSGSIESE